MVGSPPQRVCLASFVPLLALLGACHPGPPSVTALADACIARSFETFPTRATAAGWYAQDARLEDLSPARLAGWMAFQEETAVALRAALARPELGRDDRLDAALAATPASEIAPEPAAYAERFRWVTGVEQPLAEVLGEAEAALVAKRVEAAAFGRSVWAQLLPDEPMPSDDVARLRRLFAELGEHRADSVEAFVADHRQLLAQAEAFVRERELLTLPAPLDIVVDRSPAYFAGQSVGGVYPAGPHAPTAATLFYLPTPPDDASPAARAAFFRDFNHAFNVMITPHEIFPGHAVQLAWAARQPRKVRALYADGVYVEGWRTSRSSSRTSPARSSTSASTGAA
jgi:uncharacterized protein (DUF885 family)